MQKRYNLKQRLLKVEQWLNSGLSQVQWCKKNNVNTNTFRHWVDKYDQQNLNSPEFIPIKQAEQQQYLSNIEIQYSNGTILRVLSEIQTDKLCELLTII